MRALCLDPSLTATGFALMPVPLATDRDGLPTIALNVIGGIAGEIENKNARESEQARVVRLYQELWKVADACRRQGKIDLIAAEMAPNIFVGTAKSERTIRMLFAAYTVIRLFAAHLDIPLIEVAPKLTKRATTGYDKADKETVKRSLGFILGGSAEMAWPKGWTDNAIDALTVGYWLDSLHKAHRLGEDTPLSPHLAALAVPV